MLLAACGPSPTPQVIKETVVVEKEVEKIVTKEVEKVVEKIVEKIVEVTPVPVAGEEKITMWFNSSTEPPSLDPAIAEDTVSIDLTTNLFLGLTHIDPNTQEVVPELATDWDVSEDGLVWTFHMREDARWVRYNPGTELVEDLGPVTAQDVVYGTKRTLNPLTASTYAFTLCTFSRVARSSTRPTRMP